MAKRNKKNRLQHELKENRRQWVKVSLGAVLVVLILSASIVGYFRLINENSFPIRIVKITGDFKYLDTAQLKQLLNKQLGRNFFSVDLDKVKATVKQVAWVDHVSIRRKWPDTLVLNMSEQQPLARWYKAGFINTRGQWFAAEKQDILQNLPVLQGPEGSEPMVAVKYADIANALSGQSLKATQLKMSDRRSWQVNLNNGIWLKLGKQNVNARLQRFLRVYPMVIAAQLEKIEGVDMRYTNGFAVRWKPEQNPIDNNKGVKSNV